MSKDKTKTWTCPKCGRIFQKKNQPHSCRNIPLSDHFKNKDLAKKIYKKLYEETKKKVGPCKEISLPCCIHWFGTYDFIALLPKKDRLEVRLALDVKLKKKRIFATVPLSKTLSKNCLNLYSENEIDDELLDWIKKSYEFKS
ncbi:hypothetical protein JW710_02360 [Candidatus Dojkabacteria bacterium]|nr:hypothetical protein [Candidatus Dojkabacteria bacterium]